MKKLRFYHYVVFLYCFFPFTFKMARSVQLLVVYGIAFAFVFFNVSFLIRRINSKFLLNSLWLNLLAISSLLLTPTLVTSTYDFSYLFQYIASYRSILLIFCINIILLKHGVDKWEEISFVYIKTMSLYVFSSILLLIPVLHEFWMNIVFLTELSESNVNVIVYYTRFGLQGFSGWGHTILCSISVSLFWTLKIKGVRISYIYFFLPLIGCALYGRSGFIVSLAMSFVSSIIAFKYRKSRYFVVFIIVAFSFFLFVLIYINSNPEYNALSWVLEPFVNILQGKNASASSDVLKSMYENFRVESLKSLLIGEGRYEGENGHYYKNTDVGYMRPFYFGGLFFNFIYYCAIVLLFLAASINVEKKYRAVFLLLLGMSFLIFELKGESYFMFTRALLLFCFIVNRKEGYNDLYFCNKSVQNRRSGKSFLKYCFVCK